MTETKHQKRMRKASERLNPKRYVICLKYGNKYSAEYVNKLYSMVSRNLTLEHEFVCFTEDASGIDPEIKIMPLAARSDIQGWWYKPYFFDQNLPLKGTLLFLDLDMVIFRNIDHLFTHRAGQFLIIRDFNRRLIKNYQKFNSSVFRLETGQHKRVYEDFIANPKRVIPRFWGDQDWICACIKNGFEFWPDDWIQSYKWEMRGNPQLTKAPKGQRTFVTAGEPEIKLDTAIAVFHGDPSPHHCPDQWVTDHWY